MIADAKKYGFDGINIDFESLTQDNAPHFIQFIRELSVSCRNNKIVLSVDVPIPASYNMYYERDELAEVVDYVINMGYDEKELLLLFQKIPNLRYAFLIQKQVIDLSLFIIRGNIHQIRLSRFLTMF